MTLKCIEIFIWNAFIASVSSSVLYSEDLKWTVGTKEKGAFSEDAIYRRFIDSMAWMEICKSAWC